MTQTNSEKPLPQYKLEVIDQSNFEEFLINPIKTAAYFNEILIQKYNIDIYIDEVFYFKNGKFINFGLINYELKKVFLVEDFSELAQSLVGDTIVSFEEIRSKSLEAITKELNHIKDSMMDEIKKSKYYTLAYDNYHKHYFKHIVLSKITQKSPNLPAKNTSVEDLEIFTLTLPLKSLVKAINGDLTRIKVFLSAYVFSQNFIENEVVLKVVEKEAEDYLAAGRLMPREMALKKYVEKTKATGAKRFTAKLTNGNILKLKNDISCTGFIEAIGNKKTLIDFGDIEQLEYKNKRIYNKYD